MGGWPSGTAQGRPIRLPLYLLRVGRSGFGYHESEELS
jgi:hypothetical protein